MGARLQAVVDRIRTQSKGLPNIDLARLNLRTGQPLSRLANEIPDDPTLVRSAEAFADEVLGFRKSGGRA
ncbi:MAG: hypothetical protein Q8Q09_09950 [Deltaproteobacteria bacterium]|nr:hypothetical protein [Deltaproteobacteria bacterium]